MTDQDESEESENEPEHYEIFCSIFAKAIGCVFQEDEGIFIETKTGEKAIVKYQDGSIGIQEASDFSEFEHGRLVWLHQDQVIQESDIKNVLYRKAKHILEQLSDQDRLELIGSYCRGCGRENKKGERPCQCWNDE